MSAAHRRARAASRVMCAEIVAVFNTNGVTPAKSHLAIVKGTRPVDAPRVYSFSPDDQPVVKAVAPTRDYTPADYPRCHRPDNRWRRLCQFIDAVAATVTEVRGIRFNQTCNS